jgi:hypothetical protein
MKTKLFTHEYVVCTLMLFLPVAFASAQDWRGKVTVNWDKVIGISKTLPTYQIVESALLRPNSPIHDQIYRNLHDLGAEDVRFQAWYPFPKLAVAELEPPHEGKTFWDFSEMDPIVVDFLEATKGHNIVLNLATIPEWMYKTPKPVAYPSDPSEEAPNYSQGTEIRYASMKEVAGYFARLASWYTQGGFKDEYGQWHASGHHYKVAYWEVLNEVDFEHHMTPETYTAIYDAVVEEIHKNDPQMKFVGLALAATSSVPLALQQPRFFEYFLNPQNHKPGIPIDMISYHFYAVPGPDESPYIQQFTVFDQADRFLALVKFVESIRQRLSPATGTMLNEIGIISADDLVEGEPGHVSQPIPDSYWNLSAALYGYIFDEASHLGIDALGMSSGMGYPNMYYPSVTMMDWKTGQPNARYWALKLLIENTEPGDKQVETSCTIPFVEAQAYITPEGKRKILLVNKRNRPFALDIAGAKGGEEHVVDQKTGFQPAATRALDADQVILQGLEVNVTTLP